MLGSLEPLTEDGPIRQLLSIYRRMAADQLGVAPAHCLVIEDTPAGLEAAQRAGMDALAITTTFPAAELNAMTSIANFTCLQVSETKVPGKLRLELRVRTGDRI